MSILVRAEVLPRTLERGSRVSGCGYAGRVTYLQAAETVLRTASKPLTAGEITEIALRRGLLHTKGKTPAASMSAALYGAPPESPIRREFEPGRQRARRASVPWTYDKNVR